LLLAAVLLPLAALLDVALFSAFAAAFAVSSPVPVLFCCAHSGKANSALITNPAHQLRMAILLSFIHRIPFDSRARLLTARCSWRTPLEASQLFQSSLLSLQVLTTPHTNLRTRGETCSIKSARRKKVIPQFPLRATTSSFPSRSKVSHARPSTVTCQFYRVI